MTNPRLNSIHAVKKLLFIKLFIWIGSMYLIKWIHKLHLGCSDLNLTLSISFHNTVAQQNLTSVKEKLSCSHNGYNQETYSTSPDLNVSIQSHHHSCKTQFLNNIGRYRIRLLYMFIHKNLISKYQWSFVKLLPYLRLMYNSEEQGTTESIYSNQTKNIMLSTSIMLIFW